MKQPRPGKRVRNAHSGRSWRSCGKLADRAWAHRRDWLGKAIAELELTVSRNDCPHDGAFDSSEPDTKGWFSRRCRLCGKDSWTDSVGR